MRVLGPEKFGLIAFAQAFVQYLMLLSDYGFNLTTTRKVAIQTAIALTDSIEEEGKENYY